MTDVFADTPESNMAALNAVNQQLLAETNQLRFAVASQQTKIDAARQRIAELEAQVLKLETRDEPKGKGKPN